VPQRCRRRAEPPRGAADLLVAARERRGRGDEAGATTAYRELFARHGKSPEAYAALVPFGEIELGSGHAQAALDAFDTYLASGGSLEEEARFGRIHALRMLGRTAEERAAIEAMIERFPGGALSTSLRDRLRATTPRGPR
jgi:predicted TPR repeat methyltransferase